MGSDPSQSGRIARCGRSAEGGKTRIGGTHRNRGAAVATGGEIPNPSVHGPALLDGAERLLSRRGLCTLHRSPSRRNHGDALARRRFSSTDRHNQPIAELDEAGRAYLQTPSLGLRLGLLFSFLAAEGLG